MKAERIGRVISRRTFCRDLLCSAVGAAVLASCGSRNKVLKYPQNADEIVDFWEIFIRPAFTFEDAMKGLNITGKADELKSGDSIWATYPAQNEQIGSVRFDMDKAGLNRIYINYRQPISVSFNRLKSYWGEQREMPGAVGALQKPVYVNASFNVNRIYDSNSNTNSTADTSRNYPRFPLIHQFHPKASSFNNEKNLEGYVMVSAPSNTDDIKEVEGIIFTRFPVSPK